MAAYFAMRVENIAAQSGDDAARAYYTQVFSIDKYKPFQTDTDAILIADGHGNLIPTA